MSGIDEPELNRSARQAPLPGESAARWWLMALLVAGMIFCYAQRSALSVAAPFMIEEGVFSTAAMGVLLSAFFWFYAFMQVPAGWVVDRFGVKRTYALGFLFWSIASALTGLATSLGALIGLRVLLGAGQAVAFPASARAVADWYRDSERGAVTASYLTGVRLGTALVNGVGGLFLAVYSWKLFFLVIGLVPLVWLLPWLKFLNRQKSLPARAAARGPAKGPTQPPGFRASLKLLRHRTVLGIFLGFFAYDYAWFVYVNWLPGYLKIERKFTAAEMGFYSSIPYLLMSIIILLSGLAGDWLVRRGYPEARVRKSLNAAGLALACLIVPAGLVEDKMASVWLLTLSLCGMGIASPNTWTLTQAMCPKSIVGTVSGVQNFGGNLGGIIAPALTGYIAYATESFALALGVTGAVLVGGILAYTLLIDRRVEIADDPGAGPKHERSFT